MSTPSLTRLISVIEQLPSPVVVTDQDGYVVGTSVSAAVLLGTPPPPEDNDDLAVHLDRRLASLPVRPFTTGRTSVDCEDGPHELVGLVDPAQVARVPKDVASLAGEVAHEFNNLLGVIINFTSLAVADVPAGSSTSQDLQEVMVASRRAAAITARLMDMGRGIVRHPLDGLASEASAFLPPSSRQVPSAGTLDSPHPDIAAPNTKD
jgi:signal transduction histidine kinase